MRRAWMLISAVASLLTFAVAVVPVRAADPWPPFISPNAPWLDAVNYYRAMAGLAPVTENSTWSKGAYNHSCYMLYNGITHDEIPGYPGYTTSGDVAGNSGNVAVSSAFGASARSHIELWMTGPFHAIGVLRYNLRSVGFGKCDNTDTSPWRSGATLNVMSGLVAGVRPATPIVFPGNGTTTNLSRFVAETPNPVSFCGWTGGAGLPVIAMMPEPVSTVSATITGPNGPLETCALYSGNTTGTAQAILAGDNAVTVLPRSTLTPGTYTVTVRTQARVVTWSFTVDPAAAAGVMPVPHVVPAGPASSFTAITPFRFADSRTSLRITKLLANVPKRITVAGTAGLPADVTAVSANVTVAEATRSGWLTVYNCSGEVPNASTLNFLVDEPIPNAGVFPLGGTDLCVSSTSDAQLIIDINGYFRPSATANYHALAPQRFVDTTANMRSAGRLAADSVSAVDVDDAGLGVPAGATAVAVNITGINPSTRSYITAYPCGMTPPVVSNVNPVPGASRQNLAIVPLSGAGELCFYNSGDVDMRVDLLGYFTDSGTGTIVPVTPTRVVDTRDVSRPEMNLGTGGSRLSAGQTKELVLGGQRGIPSGASAVSLNLTTTGSPAAGSVTVWGCGSQPQVVSLDFVPGRDIAVGVQVGLSSSGSICVRATADTHVVIDVTGYWN